ncbi:hypothetical protein SNEBB_003115 [Seison nebaliae]|nr:hypothetical protein SNEBB_003115 [Seison nebaliae]
MSSNDQLLAQLLCVSGGIKPFLHSIFHFLSNNTDFFIPFDKSKNIGFPPGVAKEMLNEIFSQYENKFMDNEMRYRKSITFENRTNAAETEIFDDTPNIDRISEIEEKQKLFQKCDETFNGADCGIYRWSQSIDEIDVIFRLTEDFSKKTDIEVEIKDNNIKINFVKEMLLDHELQHKIIVDESIWSIRDKQFLLISLKKQSEIWWTKLLINNPNDFEIDLRYIEAEKRMDDLDQESLIALEKCRYDELRKMKIK